MYLWATLKLAPIVAWRDKIPQLFLTQTVRDVNIAKTNYYFFFVHCIFEARYAAFTMERAIHWTLQWRNIPSHSALSSMRLYLSFKTPPVPVPRWPRWMPTASGPSKMAAPKALPGHTPAPPAENAAAAAILHSCLPPARSTWFSKVQPHSPRHDDPNFRNCSGSPHFSTSLPTRSVRINVYRLFQLKKRQERLRPQKRQRSVQQTLLANTTKSVITAWSSSIFDLTVSAIWRLRKIRRI